jgi:hypothetical protein
MTFSLLLLPLFRRRVSGLAIHFLQVGQFDSVMGALGCHLSSFGLVYWSKNPAAMPSGQTMKIIFSQAL